MSDKKKKKTKQKQKQKQQQTQQVIVNVGGRARRREDPRREVRENKLNISAQPPPLVQYVYRDNLALNAINERMRENAITQTLMKTAQQLASQTTQQQPQQQAPKLATPSPALYQQQPPATPASTKAQQPTTAPPPLSFSVVKDILEKSKVFKKTDIPNENTNKLKATEFDTVANKKSYQLQYDVSQTVHNLLRYDSTLCAMQ